MNELIGSVTKSSYYKRLREGWPKEKALSEPPQNARHYITANGRTLTITQWARETGFTPNTI